MTLLSMANDPIGVVIWPQSSRCINQIDSSWQWQTEKTRGGAVRPTCSGSFALNTMVLPFDHAASLKPHESCEQASLLTGSAWVMSLDSSSTALESQPPPPLPPLWRLGVGVGCRQSHAERSALHTLDNETSGGLAPYSPNCSVLNNMLDLVDGLMVEAHFADRDRVKGFESICNICICCLALGIVRWMVSLHDNTFTYSWPYDNN